MDLTRLANPNVPTFMVILSEGGKHYYGVKKWKLIETFHKANDADAYANKFRADLEEEGGGYSVRVLEIAITSTKSPYHPINFFNGEGNGFAPKFVIDAVNRVHDEAEEVLVKLKKSITDASPDRLKVGKTK